MDPILTAWSVWSILVGIIEKIDEENKGKGEEDQGGE